MKRPKPLYRHIERLPSGKLQTYDTYGIGPDEPARPSTLPCDCCLRDVDRLWFHHQVGFCFRQPGTMRGVVMESGHWAFCVACHALWLAGRMDLLVARVSTVTRIDPADLRPVYDCLPVGVIGDLAGAWEAGQPRPRLGNPDSLP